MAEEWNSPQRTATKDATDRKCPQCGGVMDFDPSTSGLFCAYCGYKEEIAKTDGGGVLRAEELDINAAESVENCNWGAEKKTVICKSCGAESIYDALEISNECPYCGSNHVMEAQGRNTLKPGGVCPFQIDTAKAGNNFSVWIKKKLFCPSIAKQKAKPSSFKGVYLPYWTFDSNTTTQYTGKYGIDRTTTDKDGKTTTTTDWYRTSGVHNEFIDDQLICGTTQHDASMLRGIEPYRTADNLAYRPEYVAGFVAERYSVGLADAWTSGKTAIQNRLRGSIERKIKQEHRRADHAKVDTMNVTHSAVTYKYLLLPVWLSSFAYKSKVYQFMVNGQTGKVAGKTPVSALRVLLAIALVLLVIAGIYYLSGN